MDGAGGEVRGRPRGYNEWGSGRSRPRFVRGMLRFTSIQVKISCASLTPGRKLSTKVGLGKVTTGGPSAAYKNVRGVVEGELL